MAQPHSKKTVKICAWFIAVFLLSAKVVSGQSNTLGSFEDSICQDNDHAIFHACALETAPLEPSIQTEEGRPDFSGYWRRRAWLACCGGEASLEAEASSLVPRNGGHTHTHTTTTTIQTRVNGA